MGDTDDDDFWREKLRHPPETAKALIRHYESKAALLPHGSSQRRRLLDLANGHKRDLADQPRPTTCPGGSDA
jgi:hypothetical protein